MKIILQRIISDKTVLLTLFLATISLVFGTVKIADIDIKTIIALLSLIIIVSIYEHLHILTYIADLIIEKCQTIRTVALAIFLFSFFGSMLFTNDVAILTLVPIIFNISKRIKLPKILIVTLTTVYANLGSALTSFGNPQNLYLVSYFHLSLIDFFKMSLLVGVVSLCSLFICLLFFSKEKITQVKARRIQFNRKDIWILLITTAVVLLGILSIISIWYSLFASLMCSLLLNKSILKESDYGVILILINFFIIVGAVSRVPQIQTFLIQNMKNNLSIFISSVGLSQFISNVPAAVLLSKFTHRIFPIYLGVSIGGLGTLIASLANLLAFRQYHSFSDGVGSAKFLSRFTLINFLYLFIFIGIGIILLRVINFGY